MYCRLKRAPSWLTAALVILVACASFSVSAARVYTGLEVFLAKYANLVKGRRVGLVTNPTGVDASLRQTVDLLRRDSRVNLVALFAPEHGIRGDVRAGANVAGGRDPGTGLPVYTLYGGVDHKPKRSQLAKIDILIYDIQDVGSRAYTYIWHLAECMSACSAAGKPVIVLDRPNPLGAKVVDGPVSEKKFLSFIGLYPIPRVYGMTVGELARYLNTEEKIGCRLTVIPMVNYRRGMSWAQTGLPWVPSSPHIPTPEAACCFAATGTIGEVGGLNIGIGYTLPFQTLAAPWMDAGRMAAELNAMRLPGVVFRPIHYRPFFAAYAEQTVNGVQLHVTNPAVFHPATTELAMLWYVNKTYPGRLKWSRPATFDKSMGTDSVRRSIQAGTAVNDILRSWIPGVERFNARRRKYLMYK